MSSVGTTKLTARAINGGEPPGQRPRRFLAGPSRNLAGKPDEVLVKFAKQGDEQAIAALYERYNAAILRYCCSILRSQQEAEDIQQEVFVHAISALRRGPGPVSFRPWLYRVAHNACISHLRSRKPTVVVEDSALVPEVREPETVQREELRQLLDDIGRLSEVQRGALLLREMDGMSYEQIANALDLPLTTVRSTIFRARSTLQGLAEARDADCEVIQAELSEIADRRGRRSRRITSHLHVCDQCRRFREGLRYRPGVLREYPEPRRLDSLRNNSKIAAIIAAVLAVLAGGALGIGRTVDENGRRAPVTATTPERRAPSRKQAAPRTPAPRSAEPATPDARRSTGSARRRPIHVPPFRVPRAAPAPVTPPVTPPRADSTHPDSNGLRFTPHSENRQHPKSDAVGRHAPQVPGAGTPPAINVPGPSAPPAGSADNPALTPSTPPSGAVTPQTDPQPPAVEDAPDAPGGPIHTHNPGAPPTDPPVESEAPPADAPADPPAEVPAPVGDPTPAGDGSTVAPPAP